MGSNGNRILSFFDVRSFDVATGSESVQRLCEGASRFVSSTLQMTSVRRAAWLRRRGIGARRQEGALRPPVPHDHSPSTCPPLRPAPTEIAGLSWRRCVLAQLAGMIPAGSFATLTDRESVVLAELLEGHCAEEIAKAAFLSISTIRSQIKSILQKLGVNSQLAAVALARRAGWSLDRTQAHRSQASERPTQSRFLSDSSIELFRRRHPSPEQIAATPGTPRCICRALLAARLTV